MLIGRASLPHGIVVAATAGIRLRGVEVLVADRLVGDELAGTIGVVVPIPPIARLWCTPEQLRVAAEVVGVIGDDVGAQRGPSPVEARVGVIGMPRPGWNVGVRAGVGLDDEIGAPRFRVMGTVAWEVGEKREPKREPRRRPTPISDPDPDPNEEE
jgi:hypothetical protein